MSTLRPEITTTERLRHFLQLYSGVTHLAFSISTDKTVNYSDNYFTTYVLEDGKICLIIPKQVLAHIARGHSRLIMRKDQWAENYFASCSPTEDGMDKYIYSHARGMEGLKLLLLDAEPISPIHCWNPHTKSPEPTTAKIVSGPLSGVMLVVTIPKETLAAINALAKKAADAQFTELPAFSGG